MIRLPKPVVHSVRDEQEEMEEVDHHCDENVNTEEEREEEEARCTDILHRRLLQQADKLRHLRSRQRDWKEVHQRLLERNQRLQSRQITLEKEAKVLLNLPGLLCILSRFRLLSAAVLVLYEELICILVIL